MDATQRIVGEAARLRVRLLGGARQRHCEKEQAGGEGKEASGPAAVSHGGIVVGDDVAVAVYAPRMGMETTGRIHAIFDAQQVTERFRKREFVLELGDNPRYPQYVQFQLTGDRCERLDGFSVGDEVQVEFSLRGREWKSPKGELKYFNSLDVWSIDRAGEGAQEPPPEPIFDASPPEPDEDIPF